MSLLLCGCHSAAVHCGVVPEPKKPKLVAASPEAGASAPPIHYYHHVPEDKTEDDTEDDDYRDDDKPQVTFGYVEIRTYGMTLGDNPTCSGGPPVQLEWDYLHEYDPIDLQVYEDARVARRRRHPYQLLLNAYRRTEILWQAGFTLQELRRAERAVLRARRECVFAKFLSLPPLDPTTATDCSSALPNLTETSRNQEWHGGKGQQQIKDNIAKEVIPESKLVAEKPHHSQVGNIWKESDVDAVSTEEKREKDCSNC